MCCQFFAETNIFYTFFQYFFAFIVVDSPKYSRYSSVDFFFNEKAGVLGVCSLIQYRMTLSILVEPQ